MSYKNKYQIIYIPNMLIITSSRWLTSFTFHFFSFTLLMLSTSVPLIMKSHFASNVDAQELIKPPFWTLPYEHVQLNRNFILVKPFVVKFPKTSTVRYFRRLTYSIIHFAYYMCLRCSTVRQLQVNLDLWAFFLSEYHWYWVFIYQCWIHIYLLIAQN